MLNYKNKKNYLYMLKTTLKHKQFSQKKIASKFHN